MPDYFGVGVPLDVGVKFENTWTIRASEQHSRVDYSLFEGHTLTGRVKKVFLRGQLLVEGHEWHGREGMGAFLRRGPCGRL